MSYLIYPVLTGFLLFRFEVLTQCSLNINQLAYGGFYHS